jgi:hypothetical protein
MGKWKFTGYMLLTSVLMSAFMLASGMFRYAFSLAAVLLGIQFFKLEEEKAPRIWFVVLVLIFAMIFPVIYIMVAFMNGWQIDPEYLK